MKALQFTDAESDAAIAANDDSALVELETDDQDVETEGDGTVKMTGDQKAEIHTPKNMTLAES